LVDDLAQVAMTLYQQGNLSDQQLSRLCASIMELDQDIIRRDAQLQDLKNEVYPVNQFTPSPTMNYNPPPPPPPTGAPHTSSINRGATGTEEQICPNCGNPVRANALYCRGCGAKLPRSI
jgi:zinc-ribbon domain